MIYSVIISKSLIRSKCFRFSVARGILFCCAVPAIIISGISINLFCCFNCLYMLTARLATLVSNGKTVIFEKKTFQSIQTNHCVLHKLNCCLCCLKSWYCSVDITGPVRINFWKSEISDFAFVHIKSSVNSVFIFSIWLAGNCLIRPIICAYPKFNVNSIIHNFAIQI